MNASAISKKLKSAGDVFDEADFNVGEGEHPDEISAEAEAQKTNQPPTPAGRPNFPPKAPGFAPNGQKRANSHVTPSKPERPASHVTAGRQGPNQAPNNRQYPPAVSEQSANGRRSIPPPDPQRGFQNGRQSNDMTRTGVSAQVHVKQEYTINGQNPQAQSMAPPGTPGMDGQNPPVGFFSARGVDMLRDQPQTAASAAPVFDPHAESPSIRKTAGVDHTKSVPISKPMLSGGASPAPNQARDFINPSTDMHRKIGAPGGSGVGSPLGRGPSTSSYRPLTRPNIDQRSGQSNPAVANRGASGPPNMNGKRPPLNDMTNALLPGPTGMPNINDPKRARFDGNSAALPPQQQPQNQNQQPQQQR